LVSRFFHSSSLRFDALLLADILRTLLALKKVLVKFISCRIFEKDKLKILFLIIIINQNKKMFVSLHNCL
jgi:hypothetical protein